MSRRNAAMDLILRDLQRHQELLSPALRMQNMLDKLRPHLALTDIASPLLRHNLQQQMLSDAIAKLNATNVLNEALTGQSSHLAAMTNRIQAQQRSFADLLRPHVDFPSDLSLRVSALIDASSAWKSAVDVTFDRFKAIGLLGIRDDLVDRLLSPSRAFARFIEDASSTLDDALSPARLVVANSAFKIVESQYDAITTALARLPAPVDVVEPVAERPLAAPMIQFEAALESVADDAEQPEPTERIILLPVTQCAEEARATVSLVCRANEISASVGKGEIFKPTTRFVEACADIGWLVAEDKKSFGDLIDCLYFIFYEGAGKDNLRFLDKHGGPLRVEELDFIWCLKHLRNKYSRHDPDHGKPSDIARSWADLQQKWVALGLNVAPFQRQHFLLAQKSLLRMAREFVESMLSRLAGEGSL